MNSTDKIFIAGHRGMVGSAIVRRLEKEGFTKLLLAGREVVDLTQQAETRQFLQQEKPDWVIIAAAKVGGILANSTQPYPFLYENLVIEANLINAAHEAGVQHLIFLGSSCIYPKLSEQPMKEESLLTGPLEPTNQWYAIAKIAGIKLCQALNEQYGRRYLSLMPSNLYGPGDNFDLETSHVLPAMIRKYHEAKEQHSNAQHSSQTQHPVSLWGTGTPRREFLHVDDLADAVYFVMQNVSRIQEDLLNVGVGNDVTIKELAEIIQSTTGFTGETVWDATKPDGTPRKLMDTSLLQHYGWTAQTQLQKGIKDTYSWFQENWVLTA